MAVCSHLEDVEVVALPDQIQGCEECLESGGTWVHLRMCHKCGKIGCCDSSPNRHARRHAEEDGHVLVRSAEPGESWSYCFAEDVAFELNR